MSSADWAIAITMMSIWMMGIIATLLTAALSSKIAVVKSGLMDSFGGIIFISMVPILGIVNICIVWSEIGEYIKKVKNNANEVLQCMNCGIYSRRYACDYNSRTSSRVCPHCGKSMYSQSDVKISTNIESSPALSYKDSESWKQGRLARNNALFNAEQERKIKEIRAMKFKEESEE